ncbi:MAG: hypothetical protein K1X72_25975 [Pyrinomonadaceae bacterium]|nr:hypothetical protein [Pyrinomonadaceae bacterium]
MLINSNRFKLLLITICLGLLLGIAFSHELWFPINRTFPRSPLIFALPESFAVAFEWIVSSILVFSLILAISLPKPKTFLLIIIASILLLFFFDQMHLQPWAYEYSLIFAVYFWHDWENEDESAKNRTIGLAQIIIAGIYCWSGLQKLNFNFSHDILPSLFIPIQNLFPSLQIPFGFLGIAIPLTEFLIGCGLIFRKTRNIVVILAISMHLIILSLLIAKNYNSIVWFWNLTLIFADIFAFWKSEISLKEILQLEKYSARKLIVLAAVSLPILNFFGYWDSFLSGAYYSGNTEIPAIYINDEVLEKLPPIAKSTVFQTQTTNKKVLPPFEWSIADTNAPVYLEERVFRQVTLEICKLTTDKSQVELIIRKRPAIWDGNYQVKRLSCAELEK